MTRRRTRANGAYAERPRTEIRKDAPRRAGAITSDGPRRARADRATRQLTFTPGDRVVDTVTGEEGVIIAGQQTHHIVSPPGRQND
jgi:hypothetical protein